MTALGTGVVGEREPVAAQESFLSPGTCLLIGSGALLVRACVNRLSNFGAPVTDGNMAKESEGGFAGDITLVGAIFFIFLSVGSSKDPGDGCAEKDEEVGAGDDGSCTNGERKRER